jgi:multidrug efflux pump subunit AcrA (membrane-fusion protein)
MPNQLSKITDQPGSSIYSNMDEILTKPPSSIVRYGSITLLFLLLILCGISFFVKYDEGVAGTAYIKADSTAAIKAPQSGAAIVEKIFVKTDTILQKGDTIMILKENNGIEIITAPIAGKITCQRKLQQGNVIDANTLLFTMVSGQNEFKIKISLPEADADKIILGQNIKITLSNYPPTVYGTPTGEIISLPYVDSGSQNTMIDATLRFTTNNNIKNKMPYISGTTISTYIITKHKSLAAAFVGL